MLWLETVKASFQLKEKSRNILYFSGLFNVLKCFHKTNTMGPVRNVRKMFFFPPIKLIYIFHICIWSKIKFCMWKSLTRSVWEIESLDSSFHSANIPGDPLLCRRPLVCAVGTQRSAGGSPCSQGATRRSGSGPTRTLKQTEMSPGGCTADVPLIIKPMKRFCPQKQRLPSVWSV